MENNHILLNIRSLNNLIKRYFEFSSNRKQIDQATGNNGWIISYLGDHVSEDIFQKDIEDHFTITRSTASKVLSLMEQKGLILRLSVSQDARLKKIVLTQKAQDLKLMMVADRQQLETTLLQGFSAEETAQMAGYLERLKLNMSVAQQKDGGDKHD